MKTFDPTMWERLKIRERVAAAAKQPLVRLPPLSPEEQAAGMKRFQEYNTARYQAYKNSLPENQLVPQPNLSNQLPNL